MEGVQPASKLLDGEPPREQALGKAIGRGFSWLTLSLIAGKVFGAIAQLALGRWISDEQFGQFAVVASFAAIVKVFQDGGVPQLLIQRGKEEFDRLLGPAFWLSLTIGAIGGLVLAGLAPLFAIAFEMPELAKYLWIVAITLPLGAPATVLRAKLRVDLRFKAVAIIAVFWFMLRQFSAVAFAAVGFGVIGLVLPILLVTLFEWGAAFYATRLRPWRRPWDVSEWPGLLPNSFWLVATASSRGLSRTGDYLVLGIIRAPDALVGKYFFGYQFTTQIVELLATNLQHILFPALSRLAGEPERQSLAIVRTIRMLVFIAAPASLGLAVITRPLIEFLDVIVWNHKWSSAIPLMQIFAVAAPVRMFSDVLTAALSSRGEFRRSALLTFAEGGWLMLATAAAYFTVGADLTRLAALIAASQIAFSITAAMVLVGHFGISPRTFFQAFLPSWVTAIISGLIAAAVLNLLPDSVGNVARVAVGGLSFTIVFILLARLALSHHFNELTRVLPGPTGKIIRRLVFLTPDARADQ